MDEGDPREEIIRLEEDIEVCAERIEGCRKFIMAARIAIITGGIVLAAILFGAVRFNPLLMAVGVAAVLGGIVAWGSNGSTAREAAKEMAKSEAERTALIGLIDLHIVEERRTLH